MHKIKYLALASILFFSCKKNTHEETATLTNNDDPVYNYIKQLGFRDSEIIDKGTEYVVDGDILFSKSNLPNPVNPDGPKEEQYGTSNYVGYNIQPNITVRIDPSMTNFANEVNAAIAQWNNIPNLRVHFSLTTATDQRILIRILITNSNLGSGICGAAYFPINGTPGSLIRININEISGNSFDQRQRTIAHELGHVIGLRHTNWQSSETRLSTGENGAYISASHILGTPTGGDVNSMMNSGQCGFGATTPSNFDILAVQFLYPANPPVPGTVPIFRYYSNATTQDHLYTTDINELGNGNNSNYIFEGIGFFAFTTQVSSSVPVYRYYNSGNGDHYYTTNYSELGSGKYGYTYERVAFYAYPSAINGSVAVHRYNSPGASDHFYTKNQNEFVTGMGDFTYEGVAFYAY